MKGKNGIAIFGVIFLATVLTEAYGLLQCTDQLYVILGGGVAVLITGFLFLMAIVSFQCQSQKEMVEAIRESIERAGHEGKDKNGDREFLVQEVEKEMSRVLLDVKKEVEKNRLMLQEHIGDENEELQESVEDGIASLLEGMKEIQARTTKLMIQHNTENIGKLAAYNKKYVLYLSSAIEQLAASGRPLRRKKANAEAAEEDKSLAAATVEESVAEPVEELVVEPEKVEEPEESAAESVEEPVMEPEKEEPEAVPAPEAAPTLQVEGDPNRAMSPDEIAALFASATQESAPEEPEESAAEPEKEESEAAPAPEAAPTLQVEGDPNRAMSPDEIAALFASATQESAPEEPEESAAEPEKEESEAAPAPEAASSLQVEGDPNRAMSPDEIAALFASVSGESTPEEPEESAVEPEKAEEPEAAPALQMEGNPNRQLSPDEIAALFANQG